MCVIALLDLIAASVLIWREGVQLVTFTSFHLYLELIVGFLLYGILRMYGNIGVNSPMWLFVLWLGPGLHVSSHH